MAAVEDTGEGGDEGFSIRLADTSSPDSSDILSVVQLVTTFAGMTNYPFGAKEGEKLKAFLPVATHSFTFVAETSEADGSVVVAYAMCCLTISSFAASFVLNLHDIFVHQAHRRKGIGTELLSRVIAFAAEKECKKITLEAHDLNSRARKLYEKMGFSCEEEFTDEKHGQVLFYTRKVDGKANDNDADLQLTRSDHDAAADLLPTTPHRESERQVFNDDSSEEFGDFDACDVRPPAGDGESEESHDEEFGDYAGGASSTFTAEFGNCGESHLNDTGNGSPPPATTQAECLNWWDFKEQRDVERVSVEIAEGLSDICATSCGDKLEEIEVDANEASLQIREEACKRVEDIDRSPCIVDLQPHLRCDVVASNDTSFVLAEVNLIKHSEPLDILSINDESDSESGLELE